MKKRLAYILLLILSIISFLTTNLQPTAYANKEKEEQNIEDEVDKRLNDLNLNEFEKFFNELQNESLKTFGRSVKQMISDVIYNKQPFNMATIYDSLLKAFFNQLVKTAPMVMTILIIAILLGVFKGLSSGFSKAQTQKMIYIACYGAILSILSIALGSIVVDVKNTINDMDTLMGIVFPILITLTAALGGAGSVAVYQPMMAVLTTVILKIINIFIMPLFMASVIFGMVGNLSSNVKLEKLTAATKSIAEWSLGIIFSLFVAVLTAQGVTGAAFDSVSVKSAKFALSSYVPILGGYLSEGFDLVMASCVLIKNALGLCSIIILMFIVFVPVIKILVLMFSLRLAAAIIEPISDEKIASLLYTTSKNLVTLIVILLGFAFMFFVMVMLIILTCNFGVI
ncbi:MAG: stage III sporulation protein AE [Bacillota bacterium]|jgi:stage III sporulation protein AE|nr:stage III sporulation protein AE [Bacillota bacterium]HHU42908.1 hypothetical protein [Clostridiales bacterium]